MIACCNDIPILITKKCKIKTLKTVKRKVSFNIFFTGFGFFEAIFIRTFLVRTIYNKMI